METEEQKVVDIVDIHERDLLQREREMAECTKSVMSRGSSFSFISLVHSKRRRYVIRWASLGLLSLKLAHHY